MSFTRDQVIGKKRPVPVEKVNANGWGEEVYVRKLSAAELVRWEFLCSENNRQPVNYQARLAVLFASDENGNRVFTDIDADALGNDPAHADAIAAVFGAGLAFNSMRAEDHDEAKKNLENSQVGSLPGVQPYCVDSPLPLNT